MNVIQTTAVVLISLGVSLPAMCIAKMYLVKQFKRKAVCTKALITHAEKRISYKGPDHYRLQIQYKIAGKEIFHLAQTISAKKYRVGEVIPLMYLSANPQKFETDFGKRLPWILAFSFLCLSLIIWFCSWLLHIEYTTVR